MRCVDDKGSGQFNLGAYCNPKVDELTVKIQSETDKAKRDAMIKEAFKLHSATTSATCRCTSRRWPGAWPTTCSWSQLADNFMPFRYMSVK